MFSEVCVSHSVHGGEADSPLEAGPPPRIKAEPTPPLEGKCDQTGDDIIHAPGLTSSGGNCSSRYSSYWNAFLILIAFRRLEWSFYLSILPVIGE